MGNRCVITTKDSGTAPQMAVYLHWHGDVSWVNSFLLYCKLRGFRCPENDEYGWARFCQIAANTIGGTLSIGISTFDYLQYAGDDNGIYYIKNWEIVKRDRTKAIPKQSIEGLMDYLLTIDEAQPECDRIGTDFFAAKEVPVNSLKLGHEVFVFDEFEGEYKKYTVVGICEDPSRIVCGTRVYKCPIINRTGNRDNSGIVDYTKNLTNYLRDEYYRKVERF